MKRLLLFGLILGVVSSSLLAQNEGDKPTMEPKFYNLHTFVPDVKMDISKDPALFPDSLRNHPEFGTLPYNKQCNNCYEELGKRTEYSRYFVEPGTNGNHIYVQQSYYPLHFKDENGYWVTIDGRLKPIANGWYHSTNYPIMTAYNENGTTLISTNQTTLVLNNRLGSSFVNHNGQETSLGAIDNSNQTVGNEGVLRSNSWPNIDIQHIFKPGNIKTNFVVMQPLNIPNDAEYLVFNDTIPLTGSLSSIDKLVYDGHGTFNSDSLYSGSLLAMSASNKVMFQFEEPKYYDGYGVSIKGYYKIEKVLTPPNPFMPGFNYGESVVVKTFVPVSYLQDPRVTYPLIIDPSVFGFDSTGVRSFDDQTNLSSPSLRFTLSPQTCNYFMQVTVPGASDIQSTFVDLEYENMEDIRCPCQFSNVFMEVISLDCNQRTGRLSCDPAFPPFVGTCTTDPRLVPGASAVEDPDMLSCIPPQCPDYVLDFRLENSQNSCPETCGILCARAHYWALTIEAYRIVDTIRISRDNICPGDTITLTNVTKWGVPPYRYEWQPGGQTDSILVTTASVPTTFRCVAYDACDTFAVSNAVQVTIRPAPSADAGDSTAICDGSADNIGGSPTSTSVNATYTWTAEPPSAISFLNSTGSSNPIVSLPTGNTDTFQYIVKVTDNTCFRYDTVTVYTVANPTATIVPDTAFICPGEGATFNTTEPFATYNWSDGSTGAELTAFNLGNYDVTVTDGNGCTGTSNTVTTAQPNLPVYSIFATPDSVFDFGGNAMLGATIDLTQPPVDSFGWGPDVNISCLDCTEPVVAPENDQFYVLEVFSQGCRLLDSIFIDIKFPNDYWIPKAFTPNQDGLNDRFYIIKESGVTVEGFKIFNRWGQLIYDNAFPWDGTTKGVAVDMGVYSYIFSLRLSDGRDVVESGQVTLIR